jgi:hypothetical protein
MSKQEYVPFPSIFAFLNMNPTRMTTCKPTILRVNLTPIDKQPPSPQYRRHVGFGIHPQIPAGVMKAMVLERARTHG